MSHTDTPAEPVFGSKASSYSRVPNNLLGKLLDHGKIGAYAVHLLAIKCGKGPGFALNQTDVDKPANDQSASWRRSKRYRGKPAPEKRGYDIGTRGFRRGIALMKTTGILDRSQRGRSFAQEVLVGAGDNYVLFDDERLLRDELSDPTVNRSMLVAFVLTVNLSQDPMPPADAAQRFGVTADATVRKLVLEAVRLGAIAKAELAHGKVFVARRGYNFDDVKIELAKNVPAKNVTAHRGMREHIKKEKQSQKNKPPLCERTRSQARAPAVDDSEVVATKDLGSEWIVLKDWRRSPFWQARAYCSFNGTAKMEEWSLAQWQHWLRYYGGCRAHLETPQAHRQAVEIAHELSATLGADDPGRTLQALAFWVCRAQAKGKRIRSHGFIAEELARRCDEGDDTWLWDLPFREPKEEVDQALKLANQAAPAMAGATIRINRRVLFSTVEIEVFVRMIRQHGWNGVVNGINHALRAGRKLADGHSVCGWSWFDPSMDAAREDAARPKQPELPSLMAQQIAAAEARRSTVRKAAEAGIAQLVAAGIDVDGRRLLYVSQLRSLGARIPHDLSPEEVLVGAVTRWLSGAPAQRKVSYWSNIGDAIREEVAEQARRRRAA
jgi:hypothetical protein